MLVASIKPYEEILQYLEGRERILVAGCGGCTAVCNAGGYRETEALAARLSRDTKKTIRSITIERQCDDEFVAELRGLIKGVDAVLSLGCGAGVQLISETYTAVPVFPALNTVFVGTSHERNIFIERCRSCGNCMLAITAGICPFTRCAKGLQNGPCGGSENGMCETGEGRECAWCLIIARLKEQGRLHELEKFNGPLMRQGQTPGRIISGKGVK